MSRLNFNEMVNKALLDLRESKVVNKNMNSQDLYNPKQQAKNIKYVKERLTLDGRMTQIVQNMHEKLRERQFAPKPKSPITKRKGQSKERTQNNSNQKSTVKSNKKSLDLDLLKTKLENISVPRIKVLCSEKQKKGNRNTGGESARYISYESHNRMIKALKRQNEIQSMIRDHKLLKEDRNSLEGDVFAMRHILDDLQHRVNRSLKELDNKKTYCVSNHPKTLIKLNPSKENCENSLNSLGTN